jgi:hypothetical protein
MELHDNLTTEEIQKYQDGFERILASFREILPKNFSITILRDADLYSREEYFALLEEGKRESQVDYDAFTQEKKDDYRRMSMLNIKWDGKEDWTKLNEKQREQKLIDAALYEIAATQKLQRVFEKVKSTDNILVFTKATPDFIGIGSTKASFAKYWVGFGAVRRRKDSYEMLVLTPSQYSSVMMSKHQIHTVKTKIPLETLQEVLEVPADYKVMH